MKTDDEVFYDVDLESKLQDRMSSAKVTRSQWAGGPPSARTIRRAQKALARKAAKRARKR